MAKLITNLACDAMWSLIVCRPIAGFDWNTPGRLEFFFAITVGETDDSFEFNFKVENIKILPGTYDVVVSKKLLSRFTCQNYNLKYYIALEPDSTFGDEWK